MVVVNEAAIRQQEKERNRRRRHRAQQRSKMEREAVKEQQQPQPAFTVPVAESSKGGEKDQKFEVFGVQAWTTSGRDIGAWSNAVRGSASSPRSQLRAARTNIRDMKEAAVTDHIWEVLADLRPAGMGGWQKGMKEWQKDAPPVVPRWDYYAARRPKLAPANNAPNLGR